MSILGHIKPGGVFFKFLCSYLLILLIPIVLSIAVFDRAKSIVHEEAQRANNLLLRQMQLYLDVHLRDVERLSSLVAHSGPLENLMYESGPVSATHIFRAYLVANHMRIYGNAISSVADFYVYLPALDMVLSPSGFYTTRNYHLVRLSRVGTDYDEWIRGFSTIGTVSYFESRAETDGGGVFDTFTIVRPLTPRRQVGPGRGWIVTHLDRSALAAIFHDTKWADESLFLIHDAAHGVVAASESGVPRAELDQELVRSFAGAPPSSVELTGRRYELLLRTSESANLTYASLVPEGIYSDHFTRMRRYTMLAFLVCIVCGLVVIIWMSVSRTRPVYRVIEMLTPDAQGNVSLRHDEFALIAERLKVTLSEDQRLRQELLRSKPILAQRRLKELLVGESVYSIGVERRLATLDVEFVHPYLMLALVEVDTDDPSVVDSPAQSVDALRSDPEGLRFHVIADLSGVIGVLFDLPSSDAEAAIDFLAARKARFEDHGAARWAIGLSEVHPRVSGFPLVYNEARMALGYRLVKGRRNPIRFSEVFTSVAPYQYPIEQETKLMNSIVIGDSRAATSILDDVFEQNFRESPLSVEMARCLMFDLIATCIKTIEQVVTGTEHAVFWSEMRPIMRLTSCRSLEMLKEEMTAIVCATCDYVADSRTGHNEQLVRQTISFIERNYDDKNLSPDSVAQYLRRSPDYLARVFRTQMHVGLSTYIKRLRVRHARDLLADTDRTIRETAELVGFTSSNALIRAFKEIEGVTPGKFRSCTADPAAAAPVETAPTTDDDHELRAASGH